MQIKQQQLPRDPRSHSKSNQRGKWMLKEKITKDTQPHILLISIPNARSLFPRPFGVAYFAQTCSIVCVAVGVLRDWGIPNSGCNRPDQGGSPPPDWIFVLFPPTSLTHRHPPKEWLPSDYLTKSNMWLCFNTRSQLPPEPPATEGCQPSSLRKGWGCRQHPAFAVWVRGPAGPPGSLDN